MEETTGRRDLSYSRWHRRVGGLYGQDIDWVEFHNFKAVAVIEITTSKLKECQKKVIQSLIKPGIPAFEVRTNLSGFDVVQFIGGDFQETFGWRAYTDWIFSLRNKKPSTYLEPKVMSPLEHVRPWIDVMTDEEKATLVEELTRPKGDF